MTNADMIRRMNDETLAEMFAGIDCPYEKVGGEYPVDCDRAECGECVAQWAKSEADPEAVGWRAGWFD